MCKITSQKRGADLNVPSTKLSNKTTSWRLRSTKNILFQREVPYMVMCDYNIDSWSQIWYASLDCTNGIESFWSMLKQGYYGTRHYMSHKHLDRYVNEFSGRHNDRQANTITQMENIAKMMSGSRLCYKDLVA